jgi:hypothetical protein
MWRYRKSICRRQCGIVAGFTAGMLIAAVGILRCTRKYPSFNHNFCAWNAKLYVHVQILAVLLLASRCLSDLE